MHIAVTGASGMIGRHAVAELLGAGHEVRQVDRERPRDSHAPYRVADLRDLGQAVGALHGCDAVLHLAAIPSLFGQSYEVVFATNVISTFNVLEAAALLGITRVVTASSASALGLAYAFHPFAPHYVPIDEQHPLLPQDAYGLSKQVGEQICSAFHRRTGGAALSLRFPLVWNSTDQPDRLPHFAADERLGRHTLWTYIDVLDAARACRLALETPGLRDEALYIAAPETFMDVPSALIARRFFPEVEVRGDDHGRWAFLSSAKAEALLGFRGAPRPAAR